MDYDTNKNNVFVRNFEHIDGNWPSHIFLISNYKKLKPLHKYCYNAIRDKDNNLSEVISNDAICNSLIFNSKVIAIIDYHISVSKSFILTYYQIERFINSLFNNITNKETFEVVVEAAFKLLLNENRTRLFAALPVIDRNNYLRNIVDAVNTTLLSFQQPSYYDDPFYHISIASIAVQSQNSNNNNTEHNFSISLPQQSATYRLSDSIISNHVTKLLSYNSGNANIENSSSDESVHDNWRELIRKKAKVANNNNNSVTKSTAMTSIIQCYDTDSDESSNNNSNNIKSIPSSSSSNDNIKSNEFNIENTVVTITGIECQIGNKIYRKYFNNESTIQCTNTNKRK